MIMQPELTPREQQYPDEPDQHPEPALLRDVHEPLALARCPSSAGSVVMRSRAQTIPLKSRYQSSTMRSLGARAFRRVRLIGPIIQSITGQRPVASKRISSRSSRHERDFVLGFRTLRPSV